MTLNESNDQRSNDQKTTLNRPNYKPTVKTNPKYLSHYSPLFPSNFPTFHTSLLSPLPTTFRLPPSPSRSLLISRLTLLFSSLPSTLLTQLSWIPYAFTCSVPKPLIKKLPEFASLHSLLVSESQTGNLIRQEAVSMIPPLLLDIQPGHSVIDLCAAPGSKTSQILEKLCGDGLCIANDSNPKRAYMLVHQAKRLQSPALLVTCCDASQFPRVNVDGKVLQFDRILADVPCSGDGTVRKNVGVWSEWSVLSGWNLHGLQTRILERGIQMLKVGGRIVYSTCSMNWVENEAVVAEVLRKYRGCLELVDVSDELTGLVREGGLSEWNVMDEEGNWFKSYDEMKVKCEKSKHWGKLRQSMFQPTNEEREWMKLDRCLRLYPHLQDTGGFFVAVLQKVKESGREGNVSEHEAEAASRPSKRVKVEGKRKRGHWREEPFILLPGDCNEITGIHESFGMGDIPTDRYLVRSEELPYRNVYNVTQQVKSVMLSKDVDKLGVVNTGVKSFVKQEKVNEQGMKYRIHNDALPAFAPLVTKQKLSLSRQDLKVMLSEENPLLEKLSKEAQEKLAETKEISNVILQFENEYFSVFRARKSVNLLLNKDDKVSLRNRIAFQEEMERIDELNETTKQ